MDDFLTTRQVQDILKVDRITVYRMLNDGRLSGTKIGQQWRFPRTEIEGLLNGTRYSESVPFMTEDNSLPIHCFQTIQDLFSSVSEYPAILVNLRGIPITEMSRPSAYFHLITKNPEGRKTFVDSCERFVEQAKTGKSRFTCSAGLHYAGKFILSGGEPVALFLVGGFRHKGIHSQPTATDNELVGFIKSEEIQAAYDTVTQLSYEQEEKLDSWAAATVQAFESILKERSAFALRLKKIADLTQIP
ncbi:MAG: helix-turn-helix domain-containing protein [Leptolinea sp.]|nr:helix-turn-helix domain-containing protein [Leptolinea sp.]